MHFLLPVKVIGCHDSFPVLENKMPSDFQKVPKEYDHVDFCQPR